MKRFLSILFLIGVGLFSQTIFAQAADVVANCDAPHDLTEFYTRYNISDALDSDGLALVFPAEQGVYLTNYSELGHNSSFSFDDTSLVAAYLDVYADFALLHGTVEFISDEDGPFTSYVGTVWNVCILLENEDSSFVSPLLELEDEEDQTSPVYQTEEYTNTWSYFLIDSTYSYMSYTSAANGGTSSELRINPDNTAGSFFQMGERANGKNLNVGLMGYFSFTSAFDNSSVQSGNLNVDLAMVVDLPDDEEEEEETTGTDDEDEDDDNQEQTNSSNSDEDDDTTTPSTSDTTNPDDDSTPDDETVDTAVSDPFANSIFQGSGNNCSLNPNAQNSSLEILLMGFGLAALVVLRLRKKHFEV